MLDARAFNGVAQLYSPAGLQALNQAYVLVVGVGGVGGWVAEALARSGVGYIGLVDMDVVGVSNINRQLTALHSTLGQDKISVLQQRIQDISPATKVTLFDAFLQADNVAALLSPRPHVVIDCVDDVAAKLSLLMYCRKQKIPLLMAGSAGGKTNPLQVRMHDLARTTQDPLLAKLRYQLRHTVGICKSPKNKFGVLCVYSEEPVTMADSHCASSKLNCGGYGSIMPVTATFAMVLAAQAITTVVNQQLR